MRAEDLVTRNTLAPDVLVRHYAAPPAYGGSPPPVNAGGLWGLEAGVHLRLNFTANVRLRVYCVAGCYASVSALFFDAPAARG